MIRSISLKNTIARSEKQCESITTNNATGGLFWLIIDMAIALQISFSGPAVSNVPAQSIYSNS